MIDYKHTHTLTPPGNTPHPCDSTPPLWLRPQVLLPAQLGGPVDQRRLDQALSDLDVTLERLESMFLRRQPFLCGDDITVADLLAVCELMQVSW